MKRTDSKEVLEKLKSITKELVHIKSVVKNNPKYKEPNAIHDIWIECLRIVNMAQEIKENTQKQLHKVD